MHKLWIHRNNNFNTLISAKYIRFGLARGNQRITDLPFSKSDYIVVASCIFNYNGDERNVITIYQKDITGFTLLARRPGEPDPNPEDVFICWIAIGN